MKLFTNGELIENEEKIKEFLIEQYKDNEEEKENSKHSKINSQNEIDKHKILSITD